MNKTDIIQLLKNNNKYISWINNHNISSEDSIYIMIEDNKIKAIFINESSIKAYIYKNKDILKESEYYTILKSELI